MRSASVYVTTVLGLSRTLATIALAIGAFLNVVFIFAAGTLSDRFGRRVVYGLGAAAAAVWLWLLFPLLDSKSELAIVAAFASGLAVHAFMYGPQGAFIAEQFPVRVRYVGASVAYTFAGVFAGGLAPLAFTRIYQASKETGGIVVYAAVALVITVIALLSSRHSDRPCLRKSCSHWYSWSSWQAGLSTSFVILLPSRRPPQSNRRKRRRLRARSTNHRPAKRRRPKMRKVAAGSDPFEFIRSLAKSAYDGDGRAQYLVGREYDRCEMTLSLVRKVDGDPEAAIWGFPDSWPQTLKERAIAEYRRCIRLIKEDPFAELPPRKGGYPPKYWMQRSAEAGYPLAVAERALDGIVAARQRMRPQPAS